MATNTETFPNIHIQLQELDPNPKFDRRMRAIQNTLPVIDRSADANRTEVLGSGGKTLTLWDVKGGIVQALAPNDSGLTSLVEEGNLTNIVFGNRSERAYIEIRREVMQLKVPLSMINVSIGSIDLDLTQMPPRKDYYYLTQINKVPWDLGRVEELELPEEALTDSRLVRIREAINASDRTLELYYNFPRRYAAALRAAIDQLSKDPSSETKTTELFIEETEGSVYEEWGRLFPNNFPTRLLTTLNHPLPIPEWAEYIEKQPSFHGYLIRRAVNKVAHSPISTVGDIRGTKLLKLAKQTGMETQTIFVLKTIFQGESADA